MAFFTRNTKPDIEIHDPADIEDYFTPPKPNVLDVSPEPVLEDIPADIPELPEYEDDSIDMQYNDTYQHEEVKNLYNPEVETEDDEELKDEEYDEDFYTEKELRTNPESYINVVRQMKGQPDVYHSNITSEEQAYDVISGINDIPLKYRDDNYVPELVMPSLQYNLINGYGEKAEWQVKARSLIRKHQMNNPDFMLNIRDIAGITYINDVLLSRAFNGFERKLSIPSIQGSLEELYTESSPNISQPKKKSFLGGLFG